MTVPLRYKSMFEHVAAELRKLDPSERADLQAGLAGKPQASAIENALVRELRRPGSLAMLTLMLDALDDGRDPVDAVLDCADAVAASRQ